MSTITATAWVPRGFAARKPERWGLGADGDQAEIAKARLEDAMQDLAAARAQAKEKNLAEVSGEPQTGESISEMAEDLKEYDLDHYDDDEDDDYDDDEDGEDNEEDKATTGMSMFSNIKSLTYHDSNDDDPYITIPDDEYEDEEAADVMITSSDNLLLVAKAEDEMAHLEVMVFESNHNLYVHHDLILPAIPLCVEWLDIVPRRPDKKGNMVAIGTLDPDIEIWDLDVLDDMYPDVILGGPNRNLGSINVRQSQKASAPTGRESKANDEYHVDAVLSLAINRNHRNLLASGSADHTVKLWDITAGKCASSYRHHSDKVCSLAWHAVRSTVLLSGSYDGSIVAADMRTPSGQVPRWAVDGEVESVRWDPHDSNFFYVSTENGQLQYHDIRHCPPSPDKTKAVWRLQAHDESLSCFDLHAVIPGLVVTGSTDRQVKVWKIEASGPSMVTSRDVGAGKVFSANFAPDPEVGLQLAVAGSSGTVQVWDLAGSPALREAFPDTGDLLHKAVQEKIASREPEALDPEDMDRDDMSPEEQEKPR